MPQLKQLRGLFLRWSSEEEVVGPEEILTSSVWITYATLLWLGYYVDH